MCYTKQWFLGRLRRVDLITWVRCPYVSPSIRPSTKSFSDSDEIWYVGRGRWVMHDDMPYDRSKVKVTRPLKLEILRFSKCISSAIFNVSWQMTTDSETTEQSNFCTEQIFDICPSFCVTWLRTWKGFHSVCKCFCYYNTIRQVAAPFLIFDYYTIIMKCKVQ